MEHLKCHIKVIIMTEYVNGPTLQELIDNKKGIPFQFNLLIKYMH